MWYGIVILLFLGFICGECCGGGFLWWWCGDLWMGLYGMGGNWGLFFGVLFCFIGGGGGFVVVIVGLYGIGGNWLFLLFLLEGCGGDLICLGGYVIIGGWGCLGDFGWLKCILGL